MKLLAQSILIATLMALSTSSDAFTYRMMDDSSLIDEADVIVTATVIGIDEGRSTTLHTIYKLAVRSSLDGSVVGKELSLKLPGGPRNREVFWLVPGIPQLVPGEKVLVAGVWQADGTLMPNQLSLGLFQERKTQGIRVYSRHLTETNEIGESSEWHALRDASAFESWLVSHSRGGQMRGTYLRPGLNLDDQSKFTLIEFDIGGTVRAARWSAFDTNTNVVWTAKSDGQANMGTVDSFAILQDALNALTNDAGSRILLNYGGTSPSNDTHCDNINSDGNLVLWNDPLGSIPGSFNGSGVLAQAGPCVSSATSSVGGTLYYTAFEGRLEVQDNAGSYFRQDSGRAGAEVLTHELGHTLGFGHSCGDSESPSCGSNATLDAATMRAFAHNDGRGAALGADDQAAAALVYPQPAGGTISIADRASGEATTPMVFTLTRSSSSGTASVVATTAATGTATGGGTDFTNVTSQTVNFAAGSTTATLNVTINNDNIDEVDETFAVNLSTASSGFSISDTQAIGTITDDDTSTINVNDPAAVTEGTGVGFSVTLSTPNSRTVTVSRVTANGTASASNDYTALGAATLTFNAGETSKTVTVNTTDDNLDEPGAAETFTLNLSNATNATIGDASGTGSINDNDPTPTINIADATAQPENGPIVSRFVVSLSNPSQQTITAQASTVSGTATGGSDYGTLTNANVSIPSGSTTFNVDVSRIGDTTFEADETFSVQLANLSANVSAGDLTATGTILNDDAGPAVSIADASLTEPGSTANMAFTISIPQAVGAAVNVSYGTSPLDATPGVDYTAMASTATIAAGATTGTVNVPILHDTEDEWDEQFNVTIGATSSSTIGDGQAVGTILDNDTGGVPIYRNGFE